MSENDDIIHNAPARALVTVLSQATEGNGQDGPAHSHASSGSNRTLQLIQTNLNAETRRTPRNAEHVGRKASHRMVLAAQDFAARLCALSVSAFTSEAAMTRHHSG